MSIGKFYYVPRKNEDGSIAVDFYTDKEAAQLACEIEEKAGRALPKNRPQAIELEFHTDGTLISPDATTAELRRRLLETVFAPKPAAAVEEKKEEAPVGDQFSRAARQGVSTALSAPAPDPLANITSLEGKVVAFAGKLSINRPRMKEYAKTLGVRVASSVTEDTDIVVLGEDAGIKLERAQEYGTLKVTEAQWLELARRMEAKQPKPSFGI